MSTILNATVLVERRILVAARGDDLRLASMKTPRNEGAQWRAVNARQARSRVEVGRKRGRGRCCAVGSCRGNRWQEGETSQEELRPGTSDTAYCSDVN